MEEGISGYGYLCAQMISVIKHLKRNEIEDKKWNGCIHFAINSYPYGYTWYLDNVAEYWEGLVYKDYEMVFPLVWNKKFSVHYLYQPLFTQQLGLFSLEPLTALIIESFLDNIPEKFKFIEINLNYLNQTTHPDFEISPLTNYVLDMNHDYEDLYRSYSENTKRNLKKSGKAGLNIKNTIKPETVVDFFKVNIGRGLPEIRESHYHSLHRVIYQAQHYGMGQTYGVYDPIHGLVATGFFLFGKKQLINLLPATNEKGREVGAGFHLLDFIIRVNAGKKITLDFEGSMIPSIAKFYRGFGAQTSDYWRLKRNKLPWYLKIFKN